MRISAKGRYALAAAVRMARQHGSGEYITVISISEGLGISKIYLEQVFSLLKRGGLVNSVKGAQGGYQLTRPPEEITVLEVLSAVETALFENTEDTVREKAPDIESALRLSVFDPLDQSVREILSGITLSALQAEADRHRPDSASMYYI